MPLAPDAGSCAVCGARVPLIARPASEDEEPTHDEDAPRAGGLSARRAASGAAGGAGTAVPGSPVPPATSSSGLRPPASGAPAPLPGGSSLPAPSARTAAFDADAAARDVRAAARPARPQAARPSAGAPAIGTRVLAYAVDVLVAAAAVGVGLLLVQLVGRGSAVLPGLLALVVGVGQVVAEGRGGATVGARLLGLRTVDERTGEAPGVPRAFVRQLLVGVGALACLVGNWVVAASGAWDSGPRRRGWHDKASGTVVVPAGAQEPVSGRQPRASAPSGPRGTSRPWTPTPPSDTAAPATAPVPAPRLDDFLFAPPPSPGGGAPSAPVAAVEPPAPDLVPAAPTGQGAPSPAPGRPEADLLPPPPAAGRRDRGAARPPEPSPAVVPPHVDEDLAELEHTRVRDPESLRRRTGTLALHFDTGERVRVVGRGLVGRGPRAEDGQDILHVVVLNDAARSLSRVHAEFGPQPATADEDTAIWVTDRGSTNGTVVVDPTGHARVLPAGTRALVGAGWTVRLGDREARVEDD
ncbi:RDD family protein [Cellulomonas phragmiteti]|nr:RDD family protein [Cellulomonas phragmiteti]